MSPPPRRPNEPNRGRALHLAALALALASSLRPAAAQVPTGRDLRVSNAATAGGAHADIAVQQDGTHLVAWLGAHGILGRTFAGDGRPWADETFVAGPEEAPRRRSAPAVGALPGGDFLVVWVEGTKADSATGRVYARRVDGSLRAVGRTFPVSSAGGPAQLQAPDVAAAGDGSFLVVWANAPAEDVHHVMGRPFGADGTARGPERRLDQGRLDDAPRPRVAALAGGGYAVVWQSWQGEGSFYDLFVRRLRRDGSPAAAAEPVAVGPTEVVSQTDPAIAPAADGGFLVAWTDNAADFGRPGVHPDSFDDPVGVLARRFGANGSPRGAAVPLNGHAAGRQETPALSASSRGGFFAVWTSLEPAAQDGSGSGIYGRRLAPDGTPVRREVRLNLATAGAQSRPAVATCPCGRGAVVWEGPLAGEHAVSRRQLRPPADAP